MKESQAAILILKMQRGPVPIHFTTKSFGRVVLGPLRFCPLPQSSSCEIPCCIPARARGPPPRLHLVASFDTVPSLVLLDAAARARASLGPRLTPVAWSGMRPAQGQGSASEAGRALRHFSGSSYLEGSGCRCTRQVPMQR